jgi:hypothetical protein
MHKGTNSQRIRAADFTDILPSGTGRHGRFNESSVTLLYWFETSTCRSWSQIQNEPWRNRPIDWTGAATHANKVWDKTLKNKRERRIVELTYVGKYYRLEIGVCEENQCPAKLSGSEE